MLFDLLGETFARAYEHRRQHEPRKGPAIAWLLSTARYVVADAERRGQVPDTARKRHRHGAVPARRRGAGARSPSAAAPTWPRRSPACPSPSGSRSTGACSATTSTRRRPAQIGVSALVPRDPEARKARDPFELLGERLFVAAGGALERSAPHAARGGHRPGHAVRRGARRRGAAPRPATTQRRTRPPRRHRPRPRPAATARPDRDGHPARPRPPRPARAAAPGPGPMPTRPAPTRPDPRSTSSSSRTCAPGASAGAWTCRSRPGAVRRPSRLHARRPGRHDGDLDRRRAPAAPARATRSSTRRCAEIRLSDGRRITPERRPGHPRPVALGELAGRRRAAHVHAARLRGRRAPADPQRAARPAAHARGARRGPAAPALRDPRQAGTCAPTSARLVTRTIGAQDAVDPSYVALRLDRLPHRRAAGCAPRCCSTPRSSPRSRRDLPSGRRDERAPRRPRVARGVRRHGAAARTRAAGADGDQGPRPLRTRRASRRCRRPTSPRAGPRSAGPSRRARAAARP